MPMPGTHTKIKRMVKSVTFFAMQKIAPLLPAAYFGVMLKRRTSTT